MGYLQEIEHDPPAGLLAKPDQHLAIARGWACENLEQSLHADVPPPAAAVDIGPWRKSATAVHRRRYSLSMANIAGRDITRELRGSQYPDGRAESLISLTGGGLDDLDAATARELAAALLAAVDRLDGR